MSELDLLRRLRPEVGLDRDALARQKEQLMSAIRSSAGAARPIRPIVPQLAYQDIGAAVAWLAHAFGFRERVDARFVDDAGQIGHAEMEAPGGALFMLGRGGGHNLVTPLDTGRTGTQMLTMHVDDVEAHCERARAAGAALQCEVEDRPYGRVYEVEDLEGHRWMFLQNPDTAR